MKRIFAIALAALIAVSASLVPTAPVKAAVTTPTAKVQHGIIVASNFTVCYYDSLKWPQTGGQVVELMAPGFPNLDNEEASLNPTTLAAQEYLAGIGFPCAIIYEVQHPTVNGFYTPCSSIPGWGNPLNAPACPALGEKRYL